MKIDGYLIPTALMLAVVSATFGFAAGRSARGDAMTVREIEAKPEPRALPFGVWKFHDADEQVTCWTKGSSLSCMPDAWLASARIDDAQAVQP